MRTTFNLDDDLLGEAQRLTGMTERTALIHEGLRALIQRESARRHAGHRRVGVGRVLHVAGPPRPRGSRRGAVEQPDEVLSVLLGHRTELVLLCLHTHEGFLHDRGGTIVNGATVCRAVTFWMARYVIQSGRLSSAGGRRSLPTDPTTSAETLGGRRTSYTPVPRCRLRCTPDIMRAL